MMLGKRENQGGGDFAPPPAEPMAQQNQQSTPKPQAKEPDITPSAAADDDLPF